MNLKRSMTLAACLGLSAALTVSAFASTSHFEDSSAQDDWDAWTKEWETVSADYTKVSIAPGRDETELNFAWQSKVEEGKDATPVVLLGTDENSLTEYTGKTTDVDAEYTGSDAYVSNKVTVTGLEPDTTYYYAVERNGEPSDVQTITTGNPSDFKFMFVGDPQIGASKGQPQGDGELAEESGVDNTAARNDAYAWDRTLDIATAQDPDIDFIVSAGDQVNHTGSAKEEEYAGFLNASALANLPIATTIGNHDSLNDDYANHFNAPNMTENGTTAAGGDYYYSYGNVLFIVLNTNNYNVAEHEETIKGAADSDSDAQWRIACLHQDIYGSGLDHSETDGMILRTQLTPVFDNYDIDVVLQGHDHTYSRTKLLTSDGEDHDSYEFRLNADGTDYDWDHAHDTTTDQMIAFAEETEEGQTENAEAESEFQSKLDAFRADNNCYTIEDTNSSEVTDPAGILYMTANSASGSKYYELLPTQQDYVAYRSQNWLPSYSVIEIKGDTFTINTYQVNDDGTTEQIDDTFTITKTAR